MDSEFVPIMYWSPIKRALTILTKHWIISYDTRLRESMLFVVYATVYHIAEQVVLVLNFL